MGTPLLGLMAIVAPVALVLRRNLMSVGCSLNLTCQTLLLLASFLLSHWRTQRTKADENSANTYLPVDNQETVYLLSTFKLD